MFKDIIEEAQNCEFKLRDKIGILENDTFGIEIEFDEVNLNDIKYGKKWLVHDDDSVTIQKDDNNIGGEVSSPILKDTKECWQDIKSMCNYLKKKGAQASCFTGGHIHIGSQVLKNDPNNIRKLLKQWELFEPIIYEFSTGKDATLRNCAKVHAKKISNKLERMRNSICGYDSYKTYYAWYNLFKSYRFNKEDGINFKNYRGYEIDEGNTIEIRCPNGTLDPVVWQNNINFFIKFLKKCCCDNYDEEYIDFLLEKKQYLGYGIDEVIDFTDFIFEERLDKIMFLKQYMKLFENDKQYIKK